MAESQARCMGCMAPLMPDAAVCPVCGRPCGQQNETDVLPVRAVLSQRYSIGRALRRNALTVLYIGYDAEEDRPVTVEEFFPTALAKRAPDGCELLVVSADRTRFRTQVSDISDMWKRLARIESRSLLPIFEVLSANGTVYCISQYRAAVPLEDKLKDGKPIPWSDARSWLLPLFTVVARLHNAGLVHGGICPATVAVDEKDSLLLRGFTLPELHTGEEGSAELSPGFGAPEQYLRAGWQGEWTDIYALGALLYRVLTGKTPPPAPERNENDEMTPPTTLAPDLPQNISDAILRAMSPAKNDRFPSVNQFTAALLEETGSNTAVFRPTNAQKPPEKPSPLKNAMLPILCALLALSLVLNIVQLSDQPQQAYEPSSSSSESEPPETMQYRFIGMYLPVLQENLDSYQDVTLKYLHGEHDTVPKNVIYEQSVAFGDPLPIDRTVTLYVSDGPSYVLLPDLLGYNIDYARDKLTELNVFFEVRFVNDDTIEGRNNTVVEMSKEAGDRLNTKTSVNPDSVTLTVKTTDVVSGN